ncbi:EAL domain-containing protein (putative c-di-GMP-specific phosphodiesterase class I) [Motilibacter peucedani]|uniref:EAL domain-containing protein (Putative c-di-GMP-specific phosphodiesterase class I) n=1 Tax=Motilibacter peucedani TaxID=598650 RepID=A0A420XVB5_9ACTN|nr:EAL domain-containing protein [Motilibacter peucedani]RKS84227.1 EAL domain-containing protein (putative c-di-GMP-specific phosphodiesterase class I) [Motilibacter peucedani]
MAKNRSETEQQVADLLRTAKESLGLSVAFLSRMDETTQHLEVVESAVPFVFKEGWSTPRETTLCQAIMDGALPAVIPDLAEHPVAMALPSARFPRIRSFVSVPVVLSDGTVYGTFCGAGLSRDRGLSRRDKALMDVLAHAASVVLEPSVARRAREAEIEGRLTPVLESGGPTVVLQPIVDLATGRRVGAEALSRFPREWAKAPDVCFAEAHSIGEGDRLELQAIERAGALLDVVTGYVAMNVSPATLLLPECRSLLLSMPLDRVLVELSEHDPVEDYEVLRSVLTPLRERGARLAIDDVGAGFSSLRHIVLTAPEVIKIDRTLVDGVAADPVLTALVSSLVSFGHGAGAKVVAEGIETATDADALLALGVDLGQGWWFGRPGPADALSEAYVPAAAPVPQASFVGQAHV